LTAPGGPGPSNRPGPPNRPGSSNRSNTIVVGVLLFIVFLAVRSGTIELGRNELIYFAVLIPSVILHEVSHGAAALLFGDDTAKKAGRLTLNPIAHIDPFGTIILPAILVLTAGSALGYAKPVPVSPRKMRDPRNHSLLTSLAGPATNIVLVLLTVVVLQTMLSDRYVVIGDAVGTDGSLIMEIVLSLGLANVILAVFNLIPIPPLDGSAVVERLLPARLWPGYLRIRQYSMLLIFVLVFWSGGALERVFRPALDLWVRLLT
jgi:Zn-dependent protease